jgi:hypothetical protein
MGSITNVWLPASFIYGGGYRFFIAPVPDWCKKVFQNSGARTGQQNIRLYERKGLLTPWRTSGGTRQYSELDLVTMRRIGELLEDGLNLAGVAKVLELEAEKDSAN